MCYRDNACGDSENDCSRVLDSSITTKYQRTNCKDARQFRDFLKFLRSTVYLSAIEDCRAWEKGHHETAVSCQCLSVQQTKLISGTFTNLRERETLKIAVQ
jgi:hypothetical protein